MSKFFAYLRYLARHKWFVGVACWERGLFWRGITHDLSKFHPGEFIPYMNYFYGEHRFGEAPAAVQGAFDRAWLRHIHKNSHHFQFHILREDSGAEKVLEMSDADRTEMLCDWIGAGQAISGRKDPWPWYEKNRDNIRLHPETRRKLEVTMLTDRGERGKAFDVVWASVEKLQ